MVVHKPSGHVLVPKFGHLKISMVGLVVGIIKSEVLHIEEILLGFLSPIFSYPDKVDAGPFGIIFRLLFDGFGLFGRCGCRNSVIQTQIIVYRVKFRGDQGFRNPVVERQLQVPLFRE